LSIFKIFYDKLAKIGYAYSEPLCNIECQIVTTNIKGSGRLLDVGCGDLSKLGFVLEKVKFRTLAIIGVDISSMYLRRASKRDNVCAVLSDFKSLPFHDNTFDYALALGHVLGHVEHLCELDTLLEEINRVMKLKGIFIFSFWNLYSKYVWSSNENIQQLRESRKDWFIVESSLREIKFNPKMRLLFATPTFLKSRLEASNFKVLKIYGITLEGIIVSKMEKLNDTDFIIGVCQKVTYQKNTCQTRSFLVN